MKIAVQPPVTRGPSTGLTAAGLDALRAHHGFSAFPLEMQRALLHLNWRRSARLRKWLTDVREPMLDQRARRLLARLTSRSGTKHGDATCITLSMTRSQTALPPSSCRGSNGKA